LAEITLSSEEGLENTVLENCHFALELMMKAAVIKAGGTPPETGQKGHDLLEISKVRIDGVKFLHSKIRSTRYICENWTTIYNRWNTSYRYQYLDLDTDDIGEFFEAYKRVIKWIENNFVN
jgi:HEPN domain-containing protein